MLSAKQQHGRVLRDQVYMDNEARCAPRPFVSSSLLLVCVLVATGLARRLLFSPLAKIPGPRLAAATWFWLWSWDMREDSAPVIRKLHKQLGPIVRIGPNEVSINDVEVHNDVLYKQRTKFMKYPGYYDVFANEDHQAFSVSDHVQHAQLRRLMSNSFARNQILSFEPQAWEKVKLMSSILAEQYCDGQVLDLVLAFRCLALDVITKFAYGEPFNALHSPGFREPLLESFDFFAPANTFFMLWPKVQPILAPKVALLPIKKFKAIAQMREAVVRGIAKMKARREDSSSGGFTPVLSGEIESGQRNNIEITDSRLIADGIGSILAGTDTTGVALSVGAWAIFSRKDIHQRLHAELKEIWQDPESHPLLTQLESLPYLRACVLEALRLSTPIQTRFPRVVPAGGWYYKGHYLPAGTTVSSSSYLMHNEESVFPDPHVFDPTRWLAEDPELLALRKKYWAPFSLGVRQCVGLNIATAEIYMGLAEIFRNFTPTEVITKEFRAIGMFTVTIPGGLKVKVRKITK